MTHVEAPEVATLLRVLQSPEKYIENIRESCLIDGEISSRTVEIRISEALVHQNNSRVAYFDLIQPDKGTQEQIQVREAPGVRLVTHEEHIKVSRASIYYRFGSVVQSLRFMRAWPPDLWTQLAKVLADLQAIPKSTPRKATTLLELHFDTNSGELRLLARLRRSDVLAYDREAGRSLYRFCRRLCAKYLVLLRIEFEADETHKVITASYSSRISTNHVSASSSRAEEVRPRLALRDTALRAPLRFHIPWSKRTAHYEMSIIAPKGYYLSEHELVRRNAGGFVLSVAAHDAVKFEWSLNPLRGAGSLAYLGSAHKERDQLYLGLRIRESPFRTLFRARAAAVATASILLAFLVLTVYTDFEPTQLAVAVLALLTLSVFTGQQSTPSALGRPIISRWTPWVLAIICLLFTAWLFAWPRQITLLHLPEGWPRDSAVSVMTWLQQWGGLCLAGASALWAVVTSRACRLLSLGLVTIENDASTSNMVD